MDSLKTPLLAAAALLLAAGGAHAADVFAPPLIEPLMPVEIGSGWYLRGDIGYRINTAPELGSGSGPISVFKDDIDDSWTVGGGVGYRFNPWFRTDLTVDYGAPGDLGAGFGTLVPATPFAPTFLVPGLVVAEGEVSSWSILANAYLDLGTWQGITPYVGAGIGASWIKIADISATVAPFALPSYSVVTEESKDWSFSWAAMAGASIDLTPNWALNIGYRYLSLGDVKATSVLGALDVSDLAAHEIRVGARFLID